MATINAIGSDDPIEVAKGGSGRATATAYAVLCGGTGATSAHQSVAALGSSGDVLTSNGAGALPTFQAVQGDVLKVGTPADNQIGVWTGDGTIEGTSDFTFDGADMVFYNAVNDGNPEIRLGATDSEELHIQAVYDSGAQTLDYVLFQTDVASGTADKGEFRFNVDGTLIATIDDGGIELADTMAYHIDTSNVLSETTLGSTVVSSSLTSVGTIGTGTWEATDVEVAHGGTGVSSFTAYAVVCAGTTSTGALQNVSGLGSSGQVLKSNGAGALPTWQNDAGAISWSTVTGTSQTIAVNNNYLGNNGTGITFTLPTTAAVGDEFTITSIGAGFATIAQNAGESINVVGSTTTVGVGGSLVSTEQFASIRCVCVVANDTWNVLNMTGNWTIT